MKSYTDIEQSKKLAEILPIESADMYYWCGDRISIGGYKAMDKDLDIPAWSLAALLEQLDDEITDNDDNDYELTIIKAGLHYQLYYHNSWGRAEDIKADWHDDMIDACVEMILKLHKKKLL